MPQLEVSWGELIDRITILQIKHASLKAAPALASCERQLVALRQIEADLAMTPELDGAKKRLAELNAVLWQLEDRIRILGTMANYGPEFTQTAQAIYLANDERAAMKHQINLLTDSDMHEEKVYLA